MVFFLPLSPMSDVADLPLLFTQLQQRYPAASLITELLQADADRAIVRALVQVGGITLVTSMATAASVEQAEDRARFRVLELLGIRPGVVGLPALSQPFSSREPLPPLPSLATPEVAYPLPTPNSEPVSLPLSNPEYSFSKPLMPTPVSLPEPEEVAAIEPIAPADPELETGVEPEAPELDDGPGLSPPPPKPRRAANRKEAPPEVSVTTDIPEEPASVQVDVLDLTELIVQIDQEMARVSWTKEEGRNYLKRTYGKRSRQQLTDDELHDFLIYLKTLPTPVEVPFG